MTAAQPKVSAIIVTWNSERTIQLCLDSLLRQTGCDLEIILIDNASSDSTLQRVANYPQVKVFCNSENKGFCAPNNQGFSHSKGDYILFINADVRLCDNYLSTLLSKLENQPLLAGITGKILRMSPEGEPLVIDGFSIIDSVGIQLKRTCQAVDIGRGEGDRGQFEQPRAVFGICGAAALYRKTALEQASINSQVFDETYFAYYEDVDLSWRLKSLGWAMFYSPEAAAYHVRGWREGQRSRAHIPRFVRYHSYRNKRETILKNITLPELWKDLLPILGYEILALGYALLREQFNLKAYWEIIRDLPRLRSWRSEIRKRAPSTTARPARSP
jgi:GT2 family glycosyltransferase